MVRVTRVDVGRMARHFHSDLLVDALVGQHRNEGVAKGMKAEIVKAPSFAGVLGRQGLGDDPSLFHELAKLGAQSCASADFSLRERGKQWSANFIRQRLVEEIAFKIGVEGHFQLAALA